jgi:hypothetical protein
MKYEEHCNEVRDCDQRDGADEHTHSAAVSKETAAG